MSLLSCYEKNIRLEVYLNQEETATGSIYLDDGLGYSFEDEDFGRALLTFTIKGGALSTSGDQGSMTYGQIPPHVASVAIYGWTKLFSTITAVQET